MKVQSPFGSTRDWFTELHSGNYSSAPNVPTGHPLSRLFGADPEVTGKNKKAGDLEKLMSDIGKAQVRYRQFNLNTEMDRVELQRIVTRCMKRDGAMFGNEQWSVTPRGNTLVTLQWIDWKESDEMPSPPKPEKPAQELPPATS